MLGNPPHLRFWGLFPLFLVILGAVHVVGVHGLDRRFDVALAAWMTGSAAWLVTWWYARRLAGGKGLLSVVLIGAVALRVVALFGSPGSSDDVHRYVWEGALVLEGQSPYAWAPGDPEGESYRRRWPDLFARVNHPDVSAAYPPVAQLANAAVVGACGGPRRANGPAPVGGMRLFYALCDLGVLFALARWIRRAEEPPGLLVVWGWSPLVALEFAGSAHFDSLGILLLVLALLAAERRSEPSRASPAALGGLLALGGLVKFLPFAFVPFVQRRLASWRVSLGVATTLVLAVSWVLTLEGGWSGLGAGLGEYSLRWESTNLVHRWLEGGFESVFSRDGGPTDPRRLARATIGSIWLGIALLCWRRRWDLLGTARTLLGAFLVLTPTLHPWYLTWVLPFLAVRPSRALGFLVAVAPLLYWPLRSWHTRGTWEEPPWLWPLLALPFFTLLALDGLRARRERLS